MIGIDEPYSCVFCLCTQVVKSGIERGVHLIIASNSLLGSAHSSKIRDKPENAIETFGTVEPSGAQCESCDERRYPTAELGGV